MSGFVFAVSITFASGLPRILRRRPAPHPRHEFLYVVRGTIELELGGDRRRRTRLGPRESTGYSGLVPHRFRRIGEDPCVIVMVHSGA